jgi:hypothetical protein
MPNEDTISEQGMTLSTKGDQTTNPFPDYKSLPFRTLDEVFEAISRERAFQNAKWGKPHDLGHNIPAWLLIARKELREAEDAWVEQTGDDKALEEILQTAAVLVACLQHHGVVERLEIRLEFFEADG